MDCRHEQIMCRNCVKICLKCGKELPANAGFCSECGTKVPM